MSSDIVSSALACASTFSASAVASDDSSIAASKFRAAYDATRPCSKGTRLTFADAFAWAAAFTNEVQRLTSTSTNAPAMALLRVRVATKDDAGTIMQFVRDLAEFEHAAESDVTTSTAILAADGWGPEPAFHAYIVERPSPAGGASSSTAAFEPVAFALAHPIYSTWMGRSLYVEDLYVAPSARRQGVSMLLFATLSRAAHAAGCARLQWSVLTWNEPAVQAYEALGAERLEEWRLYRLYHDGIASLAGGARRAVTSNSRLGQ